MDISKSTSERKTVNSFVEPLPLKNPLKNSR